MDKQQLKELARDWRRWQRDQWLRAIIENFPLFWIFDSQLDEVYRISERETAQAYRRMKLRYFFSWEGLSKFLLAPVFRIGLTSVIITPFFASVYISIREMSGPFFHNSFPKQMGFLFFSGLFVVIARIFYELYCPRLVKAHIHTSSLDAHNLQNKEWLQMELEYCLLHYVIGLPMTEDYIRGKMMQKQQKKLRESTDEEVDEPPGFSSPVLELTEQRVGFNSYGIWLIENLLLRIAKGKGHKLFVSYDVTNNFREYEEPEAWLDSHYTKVYQVDFDVASKVDAKEHEGINEGDFLLKIQEEGHIMEDDFPEGASIHNYFNGIHTITDLGANNIVREFIAENENYWKPFTRITVAIVLLFSLICLLGFLVIQTRTVLKAIFF